MQLPHLILLGIDYTRSGEVATLLDIVNKDLTSFTVLEEILVQIYNIIR